jgi:hypothetical protein
MVGMRLVQAVGRCVDLCERCGNQSYHALSPSLEDSGCFGEESRQSGKLIQEGGDSAEHPDHNQIPSCIRKSQAAIAVAVGGKLVPEMIHDVCTSWVTLAILCIRVISCPPRSQ